MNNSLVRAEFDDLGDLHKRYEEVGVQRLMPGLPIVCRLDGNSFHTFTKGLKRPYDERLSTCMHETAQQMLAWTNSKIVYTQSDEITLILFPSDLPYGGKKTKIESLFAAKATAIFNAALLTFLPEKADALPIFDCRCLQYPTKELCISNLIWRESDATRNSVTMAASAYYSHKQLHKVGHNKKLDMLDEKGVAWADYPAYFKRGVYYGFRTETTILSPEILAKIPEKHRDEHAIVTRRKVVDLEMPPIRKVENIIDVVFDGAAPVLKSD